MISKLTILFCLFYSIIIAGKPADTINAEAFGLSQQPFTNLSSQKDLITAICYLDQYTSQITAINRVAKQFAVLKIQNVSSDNQRQVLSDQKTFDEFANQHHEKLRQLVHAFYCRYDAKILDIKKIPAIVFDKQFVIYGETDLNNAYQTYKSFLNRQKTDGENNSASS